MVGRCCSHARFKQRHVGFFFALIYLHLHIHIADIIHLYAYTHAYMTLHGFIHSFIHTYLPTHTFIHIHTKVPPTENPTTAMERRGNHLLKLAVQPFSTFPSPRTNDPSWLSVGCAGRGETSTVQLFSVPWIQKFKKETATWTLAARHVWTNPNIVFTVVGIIKTASIQRHGMMLKKYKSKKSNEQSKNSAPKSQYQKKSKNQTQKPISQKNQKINWKNTYFLFHFDFILIFCFFYLFFGADFILIIFWLFLFFWVDFFWLFLLIFWFVFWSWFFWLFLIIFVDFSDFLIIFCLFLILVFGVDFFDFKYNYFWCFFFKTAFSDQAAIIMVLFLSRL